MNDIGSCSPKTDIISFLMMQILYINTEINPILSNAFKRRSQNSLIRSLETVHILMKIKLSIFNKLQPAYEDSLVKCLGIDLDPNLNL